MKRLPLICPWIACLILLPQDQSAQTADIHPSTDQGEYVFRYGASSFSGNVPLNQISTKAFRYFLKKYPGIEDEKWLRTFNGLSVLFEDSTSQTQLFFDEKGKFISSLKAYTGYGMNPKLKDDLLRLFPEYKILSVTENFDGNQLSYWISMSNDKIIKSIELRNDNVFSMDVSSTHAR